MIKIHDIATGEVIEREMTKDELAQAKADEIKLVAQAEAEATKVAEKAAAIAKLATLGLTENDLKALGLGNN